MCQPDHYGIEYEINPWMSCQRKVNHAAAVEQWQALHDVLRNLGVEISLVEPQAGLPDLVFTANAGLIFHDKVVLSRFRHPERQGEEAHFAKWFANRGFGVEELGPERYFEGAGDALFCGETLFAGYRIRSDARALQDVGQKLDCRVIAAELIDPYFYHLDTCFCPLEAGLAIYYPAAFDMYGRQAIEAHIDELVAVDETEARSFACNAVVVEKTVITNVGCPRLHQALTGLGYSPLETPLGEYVKAGGSAKCLTLRLDGEEAAGWKTPEHALAARAGLQ
jgi:N-dimethylarginine dimethylaminohydrolase